MPKKKIVPPPVAEAEEAPSPIAILNQKYEMVPIGKLQVHPENPKVGNLDAIGESIEENGFFGVVVAQISTGYILIGNHRFMSMERHAATEVPTIWVDVTDRQARKIMLADNRTSDLGSYDEGQLIKVLQAAVAEGDTLRGTGYSDTELDDLIAKNQPPTLDELEDEFGDDPDMSDFWPVIRVKVPPEVKDQWDSLMADAPGENDGEKLAALLSTVDMAALEDI